MSADRLAFLTKVGQEIDRIGLVHTVFGTPSIAINHPDLIHELLVERARSFDKSMMMRFALYPLGGEGLFTSRGELWRRQRRLMAPLFHSAQLTRYTEDMIACAERSIGSWRDGEELPLLRETTRITMGVAGRTLFDADTFSEADEIGQALTVALRFTADNLPSVLTVGHLLAQRGLSAMSRRLPSSERLAAAAERFQAPVWVPGAEGQELRRAIALLDTYVQRMLDARRADPRPPDDLLSRLLAARDEDDGEGMSDRQIRDEILTLFVAGHETTATGLAWSIYCLCKNPHIYAEVEREVDALPADPTAADLPRLALTLRAFKEALRLYPPVYTFARQATSPTTLGGYECPTNTLVICSPYTLHRRAEIWPEPTRFDPARFLPEAEAARSRYAWLPFGAGPRVCIGMQFALIEAQLVLGKMLRRFRFELLGDEVPAASATLRPRDGMRVRVRLRRASA